MQLWWPESVPYERDGVRVQVSQKTSVEQDTPADATPRMPSSLSYRQTLRSDQFRLVYLSAVPDPDYPIHVTLEAYADDEHPEYECASYTWGGEDGTSLCDHTGMYYYRRRTAARCFGSYVPGEA
jgi:hypothetical protein